MDACCRSLAVIALICALVCPSLSQCPSECLCRDTTVICPSGRLVEVPPDVPSGTTRLDLSNNQISMLDGTSFAGLSELRSLKISRNSIEYISTFAFRGLGNLRVLHLDHNSIQELQPYTFEDQLRLETLYINDNQIRDLHPLSLSGLVRLKTLSLDTNRLKALPKTAIEMLTSLQTLQLSGNEFVCDCAAVWMKQFPPLQNSVTGPLICASPSKLAGELIDEVELSDFNCAAPLVQVAQSQVDVHSGDEVVLTCVALGNPVPHIEWLFSGQLLSDSLYYRISPGKLDIISFSTELAGEYTCRGVNVVGNDTSTTLVVSLGPRVPVLVVTPSNTHAFVGDSFSLACRGNQFTEEYRWLRGALLLSSSSSVTIEPGVGITVHNASRRDSGVYTCVAVGEAGRTNSSATVNVTGALLSCEGIIDMDSMAQLLAEVEAAFSSTQEEVQGSTSSSPSMLLRKLKFPSSSILEFLKAAEVFERAVEFVRTNLSRTAEPGQEIAELTPCEVNVLATLSGCQEHSRTANCSDTCHHLQYRSIDGSCNNLHSPLVGVAGSPFQRFLPPAYEDGIGLPQGWSRRLPSARLISRSLLRSREVSGDDSFTHMLMQMGQFLDHDLDLTPSSASDIVFRTGEACDDTCANDHPCFPIAVPPGDSRITRECLPFTRSAAVCGSGASSLLVGELAVHREQVNLITSFMDCSQLYGSDDYKAKRLRDPSGGGRLVTGLPAPGGKFFLPFDNFSLVECSTGVHRDRSKCFLGGDVRTNEQVGLTCMHTVLFREHNRVVTTLATLNPHWDDERLYQEARKIVIAEWQHIVFYEYLPKILGPSGTEASGTYQGYDPSIDVTIANAFATAAYRFGHSQIMPLFERLGEDYQPIAEGPLALRDAFFAPFRILEEGGIDPLLRGLLSAPVKRRIATEAVNSNLTEALFAQANEIALDLAALNIQRGRDHGLPSYNQWREYCGLGAGTHMDDFADVISNQTVLDGLAELYGDDPSLVDLWVGGLLEDVVGGAQLGPTFLCIISKQFSKLRSGDRFWYEREGQFSPDQLLELQRVSLSQLICDNADNISTVPPEAMVLTPRHQFVHCGELPRVNLDLWKECSACEVESGREKRSALLGEPDRWGDIVRRVETLEKTMVSAPTTCHFNGVQYASGESWHLSRCTDCQCLLGSVRCAPVSGDCVE